ncbi:hypothetical protein AAHE18_12G219900 [Arachis hypogaea]
MSCMDKLTHINMGQQQNEQITKLLYFKVDKTMMTKNREANITFEASKHLWNSNLVAFSFSSPWDLVCNGFVAGEARKRETLNQSSKPRFMLYMFMIRTFQSKKSHSIGDLKDLCGIREGWDTTFFTGYILVRLESI